MLDKWMQASEREGCLHNIIRLTNVNKTNFFIFFSSFNKNDERLETCIEKKRIIKKREEKKLLMKGKWFYLVIYKSWWRNTKSLTYGKQHHQVLFIFTNIHSNVRAQTLSKFFSLRKKLCQTESEYDKLFERFYFKIFH